MAASISRWTRAGCAAPNWRSPMRMASGFSAAFWTDLRKTQKKNAGRRGRPASLSRPHLVGVVQAEIEFAAVPAAVVEALAHRVEIRNHRSVAQIDGLEVHGEIVVDLVTGGSVIVQASLDEAHVIVKARVDA